MLEAHWERKAMSIELSEEGLKSARILVSRGRFSSIEDAVAAGLETLLAEEAPLPWSPELQRAVDAGVSAVRASDFANAAEVDLLFASVQQKSA